MQARKLATKKEMKILMIPVSSRALVGPPNQHVSCVNNVSTDLNLVHGAKLPRQRGAIKLWRQFLVSLRVQVIGISASSSRNISEGAMLSLLSSLSIDISAAYQETCETQKKKRMPRRKLS
jgi:hypothetical protein